MARKCFSRFFKRSAMLALLCALQASFASLEANSVRLSGHIPTKAISQATHLGSVGPSTEISLTFALPLRGLEELEALVQKMYDPTDAEHYGKFLTPDEFAARFAPTNEDYEALIAYAKSLGLTVTGSHANRVLLNVSGSSEVLEKAFNLRMHHYQKSSGRVFHAPDSDPEVPASITSLIHGIIGLDNHAVRRTYNRKKQLSQSSIEPHAAPHGYPSGPGGGYAPSNLVTAYNLHGVPADGSNQAIALFELAGYQASDINTYTSHFGLPSAKLTNVLVDGGSSSGIDAEVTLDIELALALAPASQIYVYEGPNSDQGVLDTYNRIATDNLAKQVSTSWGMGEDLSSFRFLQAENSIFLQMAAHGQTIYAAAGDSGAYDEYPNNQNLVVDDPASQPYVTSVGGTRLKVNASSGAYGSESVWNDGLSHRAGGGGISAVWPIPSWQQNVATVGSKTHRNIPDVALHADSETGYAIYYDGQWTIYGGTSCAAPLWAAFTALVNQERAAKQQSPLGFANPTLYSIALRSACAQNFHDITAGDNLHYSAHLGYDNASGWGSFNGANLFNSLTSFESVLPSSQPAPAFHVSMSHSNSFVKKGVGVYTIVIDNQGDAASSGPVHVAITLPQGLSCRLLRGMGWTLNQGNLTCIRSNALQTGSSYSPIFLTVNVLGNAPSLVTPTVTVSGGGAASSAAASDSTQIR